METSIQRAEHEEFVKRMESEHKRFNKRLEIVEKQADDFMKIAISVEKLAVSIKIMADEQHEQGIRLEELESRDGEMWRKVVSYSVTTIVGIVVGYIFNQVGM